MMADAQGWDPRLLNEAWNIFHHFQPMKTQKGVPWVRKQTFTAHQNYLDFESQILQGRED